jgi:predicted RNA-binding Zn-ribbon protein involved in translation (DUF1610 family)
MSLYYASLNNLRVNLSMAGELAAAYKSGSQRARVVTEFWGESNLYCPNCSSSKLNRLANNTKASDFSCPNCQFWYRLHQMRARTNSICHGCRAGAFEAP